MYSEKIDGLVLHEALTKTLKHIKDNNIAGAESALRSADKKSTPAVKLMNTVYKAYRTAGDKKLQAENPRLTLTRDLLQLRSSLIEEGIPGAELPEPSRDFLKNAEPQQVRDAAELLKDRATTYEQSAQQDPQNAFQGNE